MTHVLTQPKPRLATATVSQEGPVLLATKPLNGTSAPLAVARWLAAREERDLHVVTVVQQSDMLGVAAGMPPLAPSFDLEERKVIADALKRVLALDGSGGAPPRVDVLDGPSARTIVDAAHDRSARVIVIGSGQHDSVARRLFGECALEILTLTDRPVLVVPPDARVGAVACAVVAVDFSASSLRAARAALPMLSERGHLTLVHVQTPDTPSQEMAGWQDDGSEQRTSDRFKQFLRQLPSLPGITIETVSLWGDAAECVLAHATTCDAGLIACGRLGHSFVERLFVRSVSSHIVRRAPCPVLVAPELPGDSRLQ